MMIAAVLLAAGLLQAPPPAEHWYKGNTHAHTLWDDGDALPEAVIEWYRDRGYQFLVLSDHNDRNALTGAERWTGTGESRTRLKTFDELSRAYARPGIFALLPGQEIGDSFRGKLVHHAVFNTGRILMPPGGSTLREVLQNALRDVAGEGDRLRRPVVAQLSHPNLGWAVSADDLGWAAERFVEIYSGHPAAFTSGDATHPSVEAIWDRALARRLKDGTGPLLYGVACDDAHHYGGTGPARPGRGWIMVRARELSGDAIAAAMLAGDFYSSTGVVLEKLEADDCGLRVRVAAERGARYRIRFIGTRRAGGEPGVTLQESEGSDASYEFRGDEFYVRAVILSDRPQPDPVRDGDMQTAWTQPVPVGER